MENITKRIFVTYHKVRQLLTDHPYMRDAESKLICNFWAAELKAMGLDIDTLGAKELMSLMVNKRLTKADTITRSNRKCQERHPELRGETWMDRQGIGGNVTQEITKF